MATDLNKRSIYITDEMLGQIDELKDRLGLSKSETMRLALGLGLESLGESREDRDRAERERLDGELERICEALDERLDTELTVSYAVLASCAMFFPKVLRSLEKMERVEKDESGREKAKLYTKFLDGFRHMSSPRFCEMLLHFGAGMAESDGILSEGMADAYEWGWNADKQGNTMKQWGKDIKKETHEILIDRDGRGIPSPGRRKPAPRIAGAGEPRPASKARDDAGGAVVPHRGTGTRIPKRSDRPDKRRGNRKRGGR